jgi:hypothetical protein
VSSPGWGDGYVVVDDAVDVDDEVLGAVEVEELGAVEVEVAEGVDEELLEVELAFFLPSAARESVR